MFNLKVDPPKWTVKTGSIRSDIANSSVPCSILHESDFGACIPVAAGADVPDLFEFAIDPLGPTHLCRVVWRSERRIDISLTPDSSLRTGCNA